MELTERARRRGLIVILIATFFMWAGFFMVIPLISVHYVDDLGWAAAAIGIVLATRQLTQQGLAVFGGELSDRFGPKSLVCAGMLVRALGFASMAGAFTFPLLLLAAVLAALGGALFEAPHSAAIAALTTTENRARFYSLGGVVGGFGMTLGPLIGAALLRLDFAFVCLASATCFFINFVLILLLLPNVRPAPSEQRRQSGIMLALRDRPFMFFTALLMGFWFMWTQLTLAPRGALAAPLDHSLRGRGYDDDGPRYGCRRTFAGGAARMCSYFLAWCRTGLTDDANGNCKYGSARSSGSVFWRQYALVSTWWWLRQRYGRLDVWFGTADWCSGAPMAGMRRSWYCYDNGAGDACVGTATGDS